jgi:hypothetical protein
MHGFSSGRLRIMPNKRIKKNPAKPNLKKTAAKKGRRPVNKTLRKKLVKKRAAPKKKAPVKAKSPGKKKASSKTVAVDRRGILVESRNRDSEAFTRQERRPRPAGQSGDLQGLSRVEGADSESVNELIGEGNAFEADVVAGVERAENNDEKEVRTHEVLEDDVPGEYLDKN